MRNADQQGTTLQKASLKVSAILSLMMIVSNLAQAQMLTTVHSFTGGADGAQPFSTLVQDKQGNLYGTAWSGGIQSQYCQVNGIGCGTLFKLTPSSGNWSFNVLYGFKGYPTDGSNPESESLVIDDSGNLYGTTTFGGDLLNCDNLGCGTVFRLTPDGIETVLYDFQGVAGDGLFPSSGVVLGKNGNLYGTTSQGGVYQRGTVYEVTPSGIERVFYNFTGGPDGGAPSDRLVLDDNGNLYGTTQGGGASLNCGGGCGTVFKLAPDGTETLLYSFAGGSDGSPWGGLVRDNEGNLYGTTWVGGAGCSGGGCGTVFELNPAGTKTVLHSFNGSDGASPRSELILDGNGNLYGTTYGGGAHGEGAVFELTPTTGGQWTETLLYSFSLNQPDGYAPWGGLLLGDNGRLYGTTQWGGAYGFGTVYEITLRHGITTTTSVNSNLNPSVVGQAVTFTASVTSSGGTPPNGETITFYNGTAVLGTAPLSGGAAALTISTLPAGIFTITAKYPGDSKFAASTSRGLRQVVNSTTKSATSTTLASGLNPSIYGQKVIFTAMVTSSGPLAPTGTVVFTWSGHTIGSAILNSSGIATLTKSNLNADPYPLTAVYKGDTNNLGSTSTVLNQTVFQTTSAATISSSLNPSAQGQAVTFTAKVTSPTVTAAGQVTFKAGTTVLGTVQLRGGKASYTTTALTAGTSVIKVTYNGDSNIKGSSAVVTQVVQP